MRVGFTVTFTHVQAIEAETGRTGVRPATASIWGRVEKALFSIIVLNTVPA
jgi:hypothetical protein